MKKTNLFNDIVQGVPKKRINGVLAKYGIRPAHSASEAHQKLALLVSRKGDKALYQVANLHPDKQLILKANKYSNCEGDDCSFCADGARCPHNAEGDESKGLTFKKVNSFLKENESIMTLLILVLSITALVQSVKGR